MARKKEMTTNEKIQAEKKKLTQVFSNIESKKKSTIEKLIDNASFMSVLLDDLSKDISENGYMTEYQNGANQWGTKESPSSALYNKTISNYSKIIKQLTDLLPAEVQEQYKDDISRWLDEPTKIS